MTGVPDELAELEHEIRLQQQRDHDYMHLLLAAKQVLSCVDHERDDRHQALVDSSIAILRSVVAQCPELDQ